MACPNCKSKEVEYNTENSTFTCKSCGFSWYEWDEECWKLYFKNLEESTKEQLEFKERCNHAY